MRNITLLLVWLFPLLLSAQAINDDCEQASLISPNTGWLSSSNVEADS